MISKIYLIQDQTFNEVALQFYNHTSGESTFEQELPAINFGTDTWFLSYDQKSAEWMSGHMKHVYNYVFTQKTNNSALATIFGLDISYTPVHGDDEVFLIGNLFAYWFLETHCYFFFFVLQIRIRTSSLLRSLMQLTTWLVTGPTSQSMDPPLPCLCRKMTSDRHGFHIRRSQRSSSLFVSF